MSAGPVTLGDVYAARARIAGAVRRTPLIPSPWLGQFAGAPVYLKLETLQDTGSFKVRGAANKILGLTEGQRTRGVVTVSTGNHGRAVAHMAGHAGVKATVCVSNLVPENKRAAIRATGAELVVQGRSQDEAAEVAFELVETKGMTMVNPFDDPFVIAGQGTIGLEILEDLPDVSNLLVPVSGGGLIGGIALAVKTARPQCRVIGVSMENGAAMYQSIKAGRPVQIPDVDSLADSLQGGIFLDNAYTFRLVRELVDDLILVSEDDIAAAMAYAFDREHLVIEGGGAVGIAAILADKAGRLAGPTAMVLTGTNVASPRVVEIVNAHRDWLDGLAQLKRP